MAQYREPVGKSFRYQQLLIVFRRQFNAPDLAIGRRISAEINRNIQYGALQNPNEFCLRMRAALVVQTPDDPVYRMRLVILNKGNPETVLAEQ